MVYVGYLKYESESEYVRRINEKKEKQRVVINTGQQIEVETVAQRRQSKKDIKTKSNEGKQSWKKEAMVYLWCLLGVLYGRIYVCPRPFLASGYYLEMAVIEPS